MNIRQKYFLFIGLVLTSVACTQAVIQYSISIQKQDARVINISGRQRMLSQNISKNALLIKNKLENGDPIRVQQERLKALTQEWKEAHYALKFRDNVSGLKGNNSNTTLLLFDSIQYHFDEIYINSVSLSTTTSPKAAEEKVRRLLNQEQGFLRLMNQIVFQYDREASQKLKNLQWIEMAMGLITIFIILLEVGLIFQPMIRQLLHQNKDIRSKNKALEASNKALREKENVILKHANEMKQKNDDLYIAKKAAEAAALSKANFLSSMSHEIRTPMNGVLGITNILMEENPTETQKEHLQMLKYSAENLLNIINDILDYSKIESGKLRIEYITFDIHEVIQNVKKLFQKQAEEKNLDLFVDIDKGLPQFIKGDPYRLNQIFINLVGNAIKFTNTGNVRLITQVNQIGAGKVRLTFKIKDTGIGIPREKHKNIFESFSQADSSTNRIYGGTGLGLAITKKLVGLMKGEIKLESAVGLGSTFSFTLDFSIVKKARPKKRPKTSIRNRSLHYEGVKKILIVDDNLLNLSVGRKFLKYWDLECDFAPNGEEAIKLIQANDYQLILMDLEMPVMDGFKAVEKIRQFKEKKYHSDQLPIIALTASAVAKIRQKALDVGMNDFLLKPYKPEALYAKLQEHLN